MGFIDFGYAWIFKYKSFPLFRVFSVVVEQESFQGWVLPANQSKVDVSEIQTKGINTQMGSCPRMSCHYDVEFRHKQGAPFINIL
jgi:hypothetical protein